MERALTQVDILTQIVSQIPVYWTDTLASLAQVSQIISSVALDRLWSVTPNLIVLARCMPYEYWDEVETRSSGIGSTASVSQLTLSDQPRAGDWLGERFKSYAARVRELRTNPLVADRAKWPVRTPLRNVSANPAASAILNDVTALHPALHPPTARITSTLHEGVLQAWACYSQDNTSLFPNLRNLFWKTRSNEDGQLIPALLGPSCTDLCVSSSSQLPIYAPGQPVPFDAETLNVVLKTAFTLCPVLRGIQLELDARTMAQIDLIMPLPLHQLQLFEITFALGSMSVDLVRFAATWPHLYSFSGNLGSFVTFPKSLGHIFPQLRKLCIGCPTVEQLHCLLLAIESPYLRDLRLEFHQGYELSPGNIADTLKLLAQHPSCLSLTSLDFSYSYSITMSGFPMAVSSEPQETATFDTIRSAILELQNLELLVVARPLQHPKILPSPAIRFMLQSWVHLRFLSINTNTPERISINDFVAIVRERPFLERLDGLQVEYTVGSAAPYPFDGWQHPHLWHVIFTASEPVSPTADRIPMAYFLSSTFPQIRSRDIRGDGAMRMFAFRAARAREAGQPWGFDDYQSVLSMNTPPEEPVLESAPHDFTGYHTEEGKRILCYVQASSRWSPTNQEDERALSLDSGDIIAVTEKHEDGMWAGVVLDEEAYTPSKDRFPREFTFDIP